MCNSTGIYHRVVLRSKDGAHPILKTPLPDRKYRLKVEQVVFENIPPDQPDFFELVFENLAVQNTYDTHPTQRYSVFIPPVRTSVFFLQSPTTPVIIERPPGHIIRTSLYDDAGNRWNYDWVAVLCFEEIED